MRSYVFAIAVAGTLTLEPAHAAFDEVSSVARYCLNYKLSIKLSEDQTILCFDGPIFPDRDTSAVHDLKQDGFFVVRSMGGFALTAMKLANTLRERNATVIIYDCCLSACANYFLIASHKTYVMKNTVVAWHGGPQKFNCTREYIERVKKQNAEYLEEMRKYYKQYYPGVPDSMLSTEALCEASELSMQFFKKRGIDDRHTYEPPTPHTRKFASLAVKQVVNKRSAFWMWNPRNYGDYFKSVIVFESYPASQDEVEDILTRSGLGLARVFYDPPKFHEPP
jgi:hypothetical protein